MNLFSSLKSFSCMHQREYITQLIIRISLVPIQELLPHTLEGEPITIDNFIARGRAHIDSRQGPDGDRPLDLI